MPSPVGHSLIGAAIALQFAVRPGRWPDLLASLRRNADVLVFGVVLANLPDVDYLPGVIGGDINAYHHFYTHSIGWAALASAACWLIWKIVRPAIGWREGVFVAAAIFSHLVADLLTDDARPPLGIMLFWPFSDAFINLRWTIFWRLHKADWSEVLQWYNFRVILIEAVLCLPLCFLALFAKLRASPITKQV